MSISELSRRVGMAKSAISRYLNLTREFSFNRVEEFTKALNIKIEYLLGFQEANEPPQQSTLATYFDEDYTAEQLAKIREYADMIRKSRDR